MVAKKEETAEQKLLQMIEATSGPVAEPTKAQQKVVKKQSLLNVVRVVNISLMVTLVVVASLLALEIIKGITLLNRNLNFSIDEVAVKRAIDKTGSMPTAKGLSVYLVGVNRRHLFQPYTK